MGREASGRAAALFASIDDEPVEVPAPRTARPFAQIEQHRRREALRWGAARAIVRAFKALGEKLRDDEPDGIERAVRATLKLRRPLGEVRDGELKTLDEHSELRRRNYPRMLDDERWEYDEWRALNTPEDTPDDYVIPDTRETFLRWEQAYAAQLRAETTAIYDTTTRVESILAPYDERERKTIFGLVRAADEWANLDRDPALVDVGYDKALEVARSIARYPKDQRALIVQVMLEALVTGEGLGEDGS